MKYKILRQLIAFMVSLTLLSHCTTLSQNDDYRSEGDETESFADSDDLSGEDSEISGADTESAGGDDFADSEDSFDSVEDGTSTSNNTAKVNPKQSKSSNSDIPNEFEEPVAAKEEPISAPVVAEPTTPEPAPVEEPDLYTDDLIAEAPKDDFTVPERTSKAGGEKSNVPARITDIQFRTQELTGTLIVQGDRPLSYTQKLNPETNQFVIEFDNAILPKSLQRPLNTKDFPGQIGFIDAYQMRGSKQPRIVIQLRNGAQEPTITTENNAMYVVANPIKSADGFEVDENSPLTNEQQKEIAQSPLFSSENFEDFLRTNQKFYGRPISIETDEMEVRDVFKLISEEAGINLVIADDVKGAMSIKLKSVPWDQALVMIMKAKKLGYTRSGNVLRVATMNDIRGEEEEAVRLSVAKRTNQPVRVKTFTVNYSKVADLEAQVKPLLTAGKGAVVADTRTSSLVVSDTDDVLGRIEQLIKSLDIPPQQVLIEGKIVEASDSFERKIGINWGFSGRQIKLGDGSAGPVNTSTGLSITPGAPTSSSLGLNFLLGTLDVIGDLNASMRLFELQGLVKVISSPRILTLHNEKAEIGQTTEIPLITANVIPGGGSQAMVNFRPVSLKLGVTPQITNDGTIIMQVDMMREIAGAAIDQETNARAIDSRTAKTKVMLKNSQTAVIGGIYQNDMTEGETRVPALSNLPVFGWLFKNKSFDRKRNELLIFLTPRILGQMQSLPTAAATPSPGSFRPEPAAENQDLEASDNVTPDSELSEDSFEEEGFE